MWRILKLEHVYYTIFISMIVLPGTGNPGPRPSVSFDSSTDIIDERD